MAEKGSSQILLNDGKFPRAYQPGRAESVPVKGNFAFAPLLISHPLGPIGFCNSLADFSCGLGVKYFMAAAP